MSRIVLRSLLALALLPAPLAAASPAPTETVAQTRGFYLQLIHQARADGRARAALAYLDDFDRQYPGDPAAQLLRVNSLLDIGQIDAAEAALAAMPGNSRSADIGAAHGHVEAARGHWSQAARHYQTASAQRPADPLLRNALGYALLRAGSIDAAIEQLRGAVDLAPGDTVIRNNLILAFALDGRQADAAAAIAQSGDRQAQADLKQQIATEAKRIHVMRQPPAATAPTAKGS